MTKTLHRVLLFVALLLASCARPVALQYKGVDSIGIGSTGPLLTAAIRLYNPNPYSLTLRDGDVRAFVNGRPAGKMQLTGRHEAPARDTFVVPVTFKLDPIYLLGTAKDLLLQKEMSLKLEGSLRAGKGSLFLPVRIHYEGKQKISL